MLVFNRYKSCHVEQINDGTLKIISSMCDSFHEITVILTVSLPDGIIQEAKGEFVRQPKKICGHTAGLLTKLKGISLRKGIFKTASQVLGGNNGCIHLVDLVVEAAKAFVQGDFVIRLREMNGVEEAKKAVSKELAGTCLAHSNSY